MAGVNNQNNVIDIDLSVTRKQRFRINEDDSRILELNISDMNIVVRLRDSYPKLNDLAVEVGTLYEDDDNEDDISEIVKFGNQLESIDNKMRELVDYIFDSNVSEICAPDGSMYDVFNGQFRFEIIIEKLIGLYEENIGAEYKKLSTRIQKHTDKYVKKK